MSPVASVRGVRDVTRRRKSKIIVVVVVVVVVVVATSVDICKLCSNSTRK